MERVSWAVATSMVSKEHNADGSTTGESPQENPLDF
jgi:hypothetical protein